MKSLDTDRRFHAAVLALVTLSIALLVWQHFGLNRIMRLDGASPHSIAVTSDRDDGGTSVASLQRQGQRIGFGCQLRPASEWPFCELRFLFGDDPQRGVDFSRFSTVAIKIAAEGSGSHRLRLFLRNFDTGSAKAEDPLTWRLNELQFAPRANGSEIEVPMRAFNVASWWLVNNNIPIERAAVETSNVPMLLLDTAGIRENADLKFTIDYIEFRGKWVSAGEMARAIVAMWLGAAIVYLMQWQLRMRSTLALSREREAKLKHLNHALMLENAKIGELAMRDPLTGALNRAGIRDALLDESTRAQTEGRPLAVLFCDIDHFKRVNDEHGHAMGDAVLQQFTALLRKRLRQRRLPGALGRRGVRHFLP